MLRRPQPFFSHLSFLILAPLPQSQISIPPYRTPFHSDHISAIVRPVLGTREAQPLGNTPIPWGPASLELGTIRVWLQGSQGCLPSPEPAQQYESESTP